MISATSFIASVRRIPFSSLQAFSPLFEAYCKQTPAIAQYFSGDWRDPDARRTAVEKAAAYSRDRKTLVKVLLEQNVRWGLDRATRAHVEALSDPDTVAVVTGQQTGLFAGPLYTPLKVITALQAAQSLSDETGRTVVPVFWLEGEDHDLDEVTSVHLLRRNQSIEVRYVGHTLPPDGNLGAVGRLRLRGQIDEVIRQVDELLPPSDFKPEVMEALRQSYQVGTPLQDAFARLLKLLFPEAGLVVINPDDARLKQLAAPLFHREMSNPTFSSDAVNSAGAALQKAYHQQVRARATNLFLLEEGMRLPIDLDGNGFRLRDTDRRFTPNDVLRLVETHPERFSPNVVLRPLMQDLLLPTATYVAGPSEVAYFAQYKKVYDWAGVPMPLIHPRASASIVESKVQKVLDKYELDVADVQGDVERLFQKVVLKEMEVDIDAVFQDAMRPIHQSMNGLKEAVGTVDQTLTNSTEATRAALIKEMSALKDRVVRAEKRNHDEIRAQLEKASRNLFPHGTPQERVVSVFYFLNKYGFSLLHDLQEVLSTDTSTHQVVVV